MSILNEATIQINHTFDIESEINDSWNYGAELVFILIIAILAIPANIFLIIFSIKKVIYYKCLRHLIQARIANSFHTYLIEICLFDTIIMIYLILNTVFKVLHYFDQTPYESVYDISNFACKFFTFTVRISGAMSNYLVFFLSFTRCMLFYRKPKQRYQYNRVCTNTKYLTIYLFCICTIANVFRLELLNLNNEVTEVKSFNSNLNLSTNQLLQTILQSMAQSQCGPNQRAVTFDPNDPTNKSLFWSIFIYNLLFTILPLLANFLLSTYLIRKRNQLKSKLDRLIQWKIETRNQKLKQNNFLQNMNNCEQLDRIDTVRYVDEHKNGFTSIIRKSMVKLKFIFIVFIYLSFFAIQFLSIFDRYTMLY